jgi:hypothetical protein
MANLGGEPTVAGTDVWLTPPELLAKLGKFDLDPCAPLDRPWDTATNHFTIDHDGLKQNWQGRVWLNPPYGRGMERWLEKLANHAGGGWLLYLLEPKLKLSSIRSGGGRTRFSLSRVVFVSTCLMVSGLGLRVRLRFLSPTVKPRKSFLVVARSKVSSLILEGLANEDR